MKGFFLVPVALIFVSMVLSASTSSCDSAIGASSYLNSPNTCKIQCENSVVSSPTISAQKIDQILHNAVSPADGTGQSVYDLGVQYGIDPAFALAVFKKESTFGKYGVANSSLSLGNLRCIDGYSCQGGFAYFPSWQAGYKAFYALISGPLYVGAGLTTPSAIMPRYAPSSENNPVAYANDVEQSIAEWRAA